MNAEQGLVVVDRNTVPSVIGDCVIVFGSSLLVPGNLSFEINLSVNDVIHSIGQVSSSDS